MKYLAALITIAALSACASERGGVTMDSAVSVGAGAGPASAADPSERTFHCPDSYSDCRKMAKEYCGEAGYTRVMKPGHTDTSGGMAGGAAPIGRSRNPDEVLRRAKLAAADDGTLTVRCKPLHDQS